MTAPPSMRTLSDRGLPTDWLVENFKSIMRADLQLAPLTLLVGANSAGKSSILQSLLLVAQSGVEDVSLNGPLVLLGDPSDVIRHGADGFSIGALHRGYRWNTETRGTVALASGDLSYDLEFRVQDGELRAHRFIVSIGDEPTLVASAARIAAGVLKQLGYHQRPGEAILRVSELGGKRAPANMFLGFSGLTPDIIIYRQRYEQVLRTMSALYRYSTIQEDSDLARRLARDASTIAQRSNKAPEDLSPLLQLFYRRTAATLPLSIAVSRVRRLDEGEFQQLLEELARHASNEEWAQLPIGRYGYTSSTRGALQGVYGLPTASIFRFTVAHEALSAVAESIRALRRGIRYLGPLREKPQVVYSSGASNIALPVGLRGEFTADLLSKSRDSRITYGKWNGTDTVGPLVGAISEWLEYFGLGDSVIVDDQGKLGRSLRISIDSNERDLTMVGVGASQIIPVLAIVLSAPSRSLVLLEQPELHLHPGVQSRLGDFLAFARPDISLVVETHSEYLLTRVRRRVAEQTLNPARVNVVFAEQLKGKTQIRSIEMNRLGDLDEWPEGFFDTQDKEARYIVNAVSAQLTRGMAVKE